jgi:hypothetical protein
MRGKLVAFIGKNSTCREDLPELRMEKTVCICDPHQSNASSNRCE